MSLSLSNIKPTRGANKTKRRLGRGVGSGLGKTAGKGHKGQLARAGGKVRPGFEGGQNPLYRRLPKRGFTNHFRKEFQIVNLQDLTRKKLSGVITPEVLYSAGLIQSATLPVKVLGTGSLEASVTIKAHAFSQKAKELITSKGGKAEEI